MMNVLENEKFYWNSVCRMVCCVFNDFVGVVIFMEFMVRVMNDLIVLY